MNYQKTQWSPSVVFTQFLNLVSIEICENIFFLNTIEPSNNTYHDNCFYEIDSKILIFDIVFIQKLFKKRRNI